LVIGAAILGMALIGFLDEWHQLSTPGRSGGDPWDWLADLLGGAVGAFIFKAVHVRLRMHS
jgi:VanZ family protein